MASIDENKDLVRRYTREVFDEGNVAAVDQYLAPDFYNHVSGTTGTEDFKQLAADVGRAPGMRTSSTSSSPRVTSSSPS